MNGKWYIHTVEYYGIERMKVWFKKKKDLRNMLKKIRLQSLHLYSILEKTADRSMVPEMVMGVDYKGAQGNLQE